MSAASSTGAGAGTADRTVAQYFAYAVGAVLVLVGIVGFFADSSFGTGNPPDAGSLLGFDVNGWHNIVHLASGLFLLAVAPKRASAKAGVLAFAAIYVVVTIYGFVDGNDIVQLLPINAADNVLHLALAALGLVAGATSPGDDRAGAPRSSTA